MISSGVSEHVMITPAHFELKDKANSSLLLETDKDSMKYYL